MKAGEFLPLQKEEIAKGRKAGLSEEEIALFANRRFNSLQMHEIRCALEGGMGIEAVSSFAHDWISASEMQLIRIDLEKGEVPLIPPRPFPLARILAALMAAGACGIVLMNVVHHPVEKAVMTLVQNEVRIPCNMQFQPEKYVRITGEGKLTLPDSFIMKEPGSRLALYRFESNGTTVEKLLRVTAVDEQPPVITLRKKETEQPRGVSFSCRVFLGNAQDDVDGDLTSSVSCSDEISDLSDQEIVYSVKDSSGNEAVATLLLHLSDPAAAEDSSDEENEREAVKLEKTALPAAVSTPAAARETYQPQIPETNDYGYEYVDQDVVVSEQQVTGGTDEGVSIEMH